MKKTENKIEASNIVKIEVGKGIENRYEFTALIEVENGNPNGNPDAGNMPRIDAETSNGIITNVCLNRKIRNYVSLVKEEAQGFNIYVTEKAVLNNIQQKAYDYLGITPISKKLPKDADDASSVTNFMINNFYDIRAFGAVMATEVNCDKVTGVIHMPFARSIDPVYPQNVSITRMAVTNEKDIEKEKTMGSHYVIPYALYRVNGHISACKAKKNGFSENDLALFWDALENMFEHDRSASRGRMATRKLIIFKHDTALGNAKSHTLFDSIDVFCKEGKSPARCYNDYTVTVDESVIPKEVKLEIKNF